MNMFNKRDKSTLKIWAMDQIKEAILLGKLKSADRIIEADLAKEMEISRFPIREAISALEKEGMLISIPYKGTYVSTIEEHDIDEIFQIRGALEGLAVITLINNLSNEAITELELVLTDMEGALPNEENELFVQDLRFHEKICELSGNRRLLKIWKTLHDQLTILFAIEQHASRGSKYFDLTVTNHYLIYEAIKNKNSSLAKKRITKNIENGLKNLKRIRKINHRK